MQLFEFKTAKQIWPPIIPRDMSIFEPIPHNPRYSADWWKYRDEEAAARRAESELVNARYERQAKGCWLDPVANGWRLIGAANMSYRELLTKAMFTESLTPSPEFENSQDANGHGIQRVAYPAAAPRGGAAADEVRLGM